ncbi:hypothetical protein ACV34L_32215, partial [Pseudomonas aeruginosa]
SWPVLAAGLLTCVLLEKSRRFGYGAQLPAAVRQVLAEYAARACTSSAAFCCAAGLRLSLAALVLIVGLALHVAEVGLIGLLVIVLITAFTGVTDEHQIGRAFQEALPFTALLVDHRDHREEHHQQR